jgi:hypothetical protein
MTVFAILLPSPEPRVVEAIKRVYPNDHLTISDTQWLVSASGTVMDLSAKLGVFDPKNPNLPPTGNAVIFATSSYFGRAQANIWEWLKAKLESPPSG